MKKGIISIFVILLLLIAGCSNSPDQTNLAPPDADPGITATVPAVDLHSASSKKTVKWAVPEVYSISAAALDHVNRLLAEKECDFTLSFIPIEFGGYTQACLDYQSRNGALDIVTIGLSDPQSLRGKLLLDGYFAPMDDFLNENPEIKALFSANQWKSASISGTIYLIPSWPNYSSVRYAFGNGVSDADLSEFTGSVEQLDSLLSLATEEAPVFFDADIQHLLPFDIVAGVALSHQTGKAVNVFSDEGYGKLIRLLNSLYVSNRLVIPSDGELPESNDTYSAYITMNADWQPPGGYLLRERKPYVASRLIGLGVPSASENRENAFMLLKLLFTDTTLANLLIYGEQNVDYILVDGYACKPNGTPADSFLNEFSLGAALYKGVYPSKSPQWNATRPQNMASDPVDYINRNSIPSPFLGFYPDVSGYEEQVSMLTRIVSEYKDQTPVWKAKPGSDLDTPFDMDFEKALASINNRMQEAKIDEWLAEVNRQLDSFRSRP